MTKVIFMNIQLFVEKEEATRLIFVDIFQPGPKFDKDASFDCEMSNVKPSRCSTYFLTKNSGLKFLLKSLC